MCTTFDLSTFDTLTNWIGELVRLKVSSRRLCDKGFAIRGVQHITT